MICFAFCRAEPAFKPKKHYAKQEPEHSIYIIEDYPPRKFSFKECVEMHKEAAMPEMANMMHTQIYADIELDCTTNKKVNFIFTSHNIHFENSINIGNIFFYFLLSSMTI